MATIKDIARILTDKYNMKGKDAEVFVSAFVDTILEGLETDRLVKVKGLGTFKITTVKERSSVNVNTGERVLIESHDKISFTPDTTLRDIVNKPFAQFETVILGDDVTFDDMPSDSDDVLDAEEQDTMPMSLVETTTEDANSDNAIVEDIASEKIETEETSAEKPVGEKDDAQKEITMDESVAEIAPVATEQHTEPSTEESISMPVTEPATESDMEEQVAEVHVSGQLGEPVVIAPIEESYESDEDDNDNDDDDDVSCKKVFILYAILVNIIIGIATFTAGYYLGINDVFEQKTDVVVAKTDVSKEVKKEHQKAPAVAAQKTEETQKAEELAKQKAEALKIEEARKAEEAAKQKVEAQKAEQAKKDAEIAKQRAADEAKKKSELTQEQKDDAFAAQYNKDVRVRTGAYKIIGTKATVTVREGQTLSSISRTYLGPGMECYVEAYNGTNVATPGSKLLIPKLVLKKKVRK